MPFSRLRSLISDSVLPALSRFSSRSVSQRCQNQLGYLSLSLVCLSSVSWHTCSIESSAWPIQDLPVPVCIPLCLSWLHGVGCGDFLQHWSMLRPAPLSVWFALVGGLAWTSWSQWVCPWWFQVWLALLYSAFCPASADLSVLLLGGPVHSQWHWAPHFDTVGRGGVQYPLQP